MPSDRSDYDALVVVSPAVAGGERKDQDRAAWFQKSHVAVVCDGTTSSPHAAEAADLAAKFAPLLFKGSPKVRLSTLCEFLLEQRLQSLSRPVVLKADTPAGMRDTLVEIVLKQRGQGFQTTLASAELTVSDGRALVRLVTCGDSAFYAFDAEGRLLVDSLRHSGPPAEPIPDGDAGGHCGSEAFKLAPGDSVLARVVCTLSDWPDLAAQTGIPPKHAGRWFVCKPLDAVAGARWGGDEVRRAEQVVLAPGHLLIVPEYLTAKPRDDNYRRYRRFVFSRQMRVWPSAGSAAGPAQTHAGSSVTAVLPDHFFAGNWHFWEETFPVGAHFVLATDGFYGCFSGAPDLWCWLERHRPNLTDEDSRDGLMRELHAGLESKRGDDDISFVWLRPRNS